MYDSTPASKSGGSWTGLICIICGIILLLGAFIAYTYEERYGYRNPITHEWTYQYSVYPHRDLGMVLVVLSVVLIIAF